MFGFDESRTRHKDPRTQWRRLAAHRRDGCAFRAESYVRSRFPECDAPRNVDAARYSPDDRRARVHRLQNRHKGWRHRFDTCRVEPRFERVRRRDSLEGRDVRRRRESRYRCRGSRSAHGVFRYGYADARSPGLRGCETRRGHSRQGRRNAPSGSTNTAIPTFLSV